MIKKTRIQIAVVLLVLILFFVAFVYGSAVLDMFTSIKSDAESVLATMQSSVMIIRDPESGKPVLNINPALRDFEDEDLEDDYNRRASFCALVVDNGSSIDVSFIQKGNLYTDEQIKLIVSSVLSSDVEDGRVEGYYFSIREKGDVEVLAVIDKSYDILALRRIALTMLFISVVGFVFIAVIVWILTGFITRPIADAMDTKKRFISDASHELKTPLTIISANTEVLKEDVGDSAWLGNIEAQTHRMQELVQELLQLSAIEEDNKKSAKKERFLLTDVATEVVLPFDAIAYEKGLNLTYDFEQNLYTVGDPDSFRKIIGTLVDNAIKYASENGDVDISLKRHQNTAVLIVYNTGCGIKDSERGKIFDRFYRSDQSRARTTGGSGLGLAIAQAAAKQNNWALKLDSEEHKYTKFLLSIKLT